MREEFSKLIESLMDIETIVKELSAWRVMKDILLDGYHKRLLPIVQVESARKQRVEVEKELEKEKNIKQNAGSEFMQQIMTGISDTLDIKSALQALRSSIEKHGRNGSAPGESALRHQIDVYFAENLPDFNGSWPNTEDRADQLSVIGNIWSRDQERSKEELDLELVAKQSNPRADANLQAESNRLNEVAPRRTNNLSFKRVAA